MLRFILQPEQIAQPSKFDLEIWLLETALTKAQANTDQAIKEIRGARV